MNNEVSIKEIFSCMEDIHMFKKKCVGETSTRIQQHKKSIVDKKWDLKGVCDTMQEHAKWDSTGKGQLF